jgi:hypothetical protein
LSPKMNSKPAGKRESPGGTSSGLALQHQLGETPTNRIDDEPLFPSVALSW